MAQCRELWLCCDCGCDTPKITIHSSCHRVTHSWDSSEGVFFSSRLQFLKGLDSATFIFYTITRNEEE